MQNMRGGMPNKQGNVTLRCQVRVFSLISASSKSQMRKINPAAKEITPLPKVQLKASLLLHWYTMNSLLILQFRLCYTVHTYNSSPLSMFNFLDYIFHLTSVLYNFTIDIEGMVRLVVINAAQTGSVVGFVLLSNCWQPLQPPLKTPQTATKGKLRSHWMVL